jgi:hypothetical protein
MRAHLNYAYTHTKVVMTYFSRAIIRMFVERILDEVFPDETGAARLQQIGLFTWSTRSRTTRSR